MSQYGKIINNKIKITLKYMKVIFILLFILREVTFVKKYKKYILIFLFILTIGSIAFIKLNNYIKDMNLYSNIIEKNWGINLSKEYEEIYNKDEKSFLGDGNRYHLFQYKNPININKNFDWINEKNSSIESQILKILGELDVEEKYMPNFEKNYKYYFKSNQDSSKIYILYFEDEKKVHTIESLY